MVLMLLALLDWFILPQCLPKTYVTGTTEGDDSGETSEMHTHTLLSKRDACLIYHSSQFERGNTKDRASALLQTPL